MNADFKNTHWQWIEYKYKFQYHDHFLMNITRGPVHQFVHGQGPAGLGWAGGEEELVGGWPAGSEIWPIRAW